MECESISPALQPETIPQMSSKAFQKMLYSWFEEKGLVADLRSYLRVQMISRLKATKLGKLASKPTISLSKQAMNLVVAEYLLREGHHYTLSVFSTEVPHQLPLSLIETDSWRLDKASLLNLLELIGIGKFSQEAVDILHDYFNKDKPLFNCIVSSTKAEVESISSLSDENAICYVRKTLTPIGLPRNIVVNLENKITKDIDKEKANTLRVKEEYEKLMKELKTEISEKDNCIKSLIEKQLKQSKENSKIKDDFRKIRKRINQIVIQETNLQRREDELNKKQCNLNQLENELKLEKTKKCLIKHCNDSCINNIETIKDLYEEMENLKEINNNKQIELEKLQLKLDLLVKDLENSQKKIEFFSTKSNQVQINFGNDTESTTSEEITEDILEQVHKRLEQLEKETDDLDLKYKKLQI